MEEKLIDLHKLWKDEESFAQCIADNVESLGKLIGKDMKIESFEEERNGNANILLAEEVTAQKGETEQKKKAVIECNLGLPLHGTDELIYQAYKNEADICIWIVGEENENTIQDIEKMIEDDCRHLYYLIQAYSFDSEENEDDDEDDDEDVDEDDEYVCINLKALAYPDQYVHGNVGDDVPIVINKNDL